MVTPSLPRPLTEEQAWAEWCDEQQARYDAQCSAEHITGPRHDPTGVTCDLPTGHAGRHEGVFIDDHRIKWGRGA